MYLDNLYNIIEFQGHRSKVKAIGVFLGFLCDVHNVCGYPQTVLSLEKGLMILFGFGVNCRFR